MNDLTHALALLFMMSLAACVPNPAERKTRVPDELDYRIEKTVDRITQGELPRITSDFLLAGLTLDPRFERRFTNYSGDQIGRYLSAMSNTDTGKQSINLHELVEAVIANQLADGRFGADTLSFEAEKIEGPQMALLWGNGRLLTGLMDYYAAYPDKKNALAAAIRLGDFLQGVADACTRPEIINRFKTMGAMGFICFTQITEGMVKLYNATGMEKYRKLAEDTYPLLPEFGNQHSHGYLNTLRGVVMLYEATKNPVHLRFAESIYQEIQHSDSYLVTGGLPEFFGSWAGADGVRDEGCSEADFFMLCLQLWKATGNNKYLDDGEYLFMNHMLYNQFLSGDFGHHVIKPGFGFVTAPMPGQSWWCCNYHGLQALYEARQHVVTRNDALRRINLYYPVNYKDDGFAFVMEKNGATPHTFQLTITDLKNDSPGLAFRNPPWSGSTLVTLNGKPAETKEEEGYITIGNKLHRGDEILITLDPVLKLVDQQRKEIDLSTLVAGPVKAALIYGPWLLSADDVYQNLFMTELSEGNILYLPEDQQVIHARTDIVPQHSYNAEAYLSFSFLKEGTSQRGTVILRPISEVSFQSASNVRYWFNVAPLIK